MSLPRYRKIQAKQMYLRLFILRCDHNLFNSPWLADMYGRKKVIEKFLLVGTVFIIITALSFNILMMCIAGFFIGSTYVAINIIAFVLCMESLDFKYRNYYLGLYQIAWPLGAAFSTALYWSGLYWRYTILISAGILLLELYLLAYVAESPRFLLTNIFDVKGCQKVMNRISLINGEGNFLYILNTENTQNSLLSLRKALNSKWVIFRIAMCSAMWFTTNFGRYSMLFFKSDKPILELLESDTNLSPYILSIVNNIINIISVCIIYVPLINYFGRKKIAFISLLIEGYYFFRCLYLYIYKRLIL